MPGNLGERNAPWYFNSEGGRRRTNTVVATLHFLRHATTVFVRRWVVWPAHLTGFRSEGGEVPYTVTFSTQGARRRTRRYVEHSEGRKRC